MTTEEAFEIAEALDKACDYIDKLIMLGTFNNNIYEYTTIKEATNFVNETRNNLLQ